MLKFDFKAKSICSEFNVTNICKHYNINKKIKWEEPLILKGEYLPQLKNTENKMVYIYHFGTIVFVNFEESEIKQFIQQLHNIPGLIKSINKDIKYNCSDEYKLICDEEFKEEMEFETYKTPSIEDYHINMTALVLAKSVALETIENRVLIVSDEVENIITLLKKGKLNINGKKICATIGGVLSFKHTIISYIMLLDKPDVTWKNENAKIFFNELSDVFEINDRYETVNVKTQFLLDATQIFVDFSHSKRATILEVIVIVLILIEVVNAFRDEFIAFLPIMINIL